MTKHQNNNVVGGVIITLLIGIIILLFIPWGPKVDKYPLKDILENVGDAPISVFKVKYYMEDPEFSNKDSIIHTSFTLTGPMLGDDGVETDITGKLVVRNAKKIYFRIDDLVVQDESKIREATVRKVLNTYFNQKSVYSPPLFGDIDKVYIDGDTVCLQYEKEKPIGVKILGGLLGIGAIVIIMANLGFFLNPLNCCNMELRM